MSRKPYQVRNVRQVRAERHIQPGQRRVRPWEKMTSVRAIKLSNVVGLAVVWVVVSAVFAISGWDAWSWADVLLPAGFAAWGYLESETVFLKPEESNGG